MHSPHLGSLHLVTVNFVSSLSENFALVSNFLKFGGWRLLLRKVLFENNVFSLSSLKRMVLLWRMSGYISGFWGLNVVT